jgi:hypothetical protein
VGRKAIDLTGKIFGKVTVVVRDPRSIHRPRWVCECKCGTLFLRKTDDLRRIKNEDSYSCGCAGSVEAGTHGMSNTKIYFIWSNMLRRCYQDSNLKYSRYGGRGIKVCDEWRQSFVNFYRDMGEPPEKMTLGRIDNDGDYCKSNCRWETNAQQAGNTSQTKYLTYKEETLSLAEWGRRLNGNPDSVAKRIRRGWTVEQAITTPIGGNKTKF